MPAKVPETDPMPSSDSPIVRARRQRLSDWIAQRHGGQQADFVSATGLNQGLVSAVVGGSKSFGEKLAASIEAKAGMPAGYLVNPTTSAMPETRTNVPLDLALARAENDIDVLQMVLGSMFTVMLRHRPAEAEEFVKQLGALPPKFQQGGLVELLRKASRAQKAVAKGVS